jgi:hypothetical protein
MTELKTDLKKMQKPEKKKFLSMDLAERMIRVEQKVSATFNKHLPYNQTEYYKSMSSSEKEDFENFLKSKTTKKVLFSLALIVPLILVFLLNTNLTGNVVKENFGTGSYGFLIIFFSVIFLLIALIAISKIMRKRTMDKKFNSHVAVIDNVLSRKGMVSKKAF